MQTIPRPTHSDRHALVWGALGFLGRPLVKRLLEDGARVSVLCRSRSLYPAARWASEVQWFEWRDGESNRETLVAAVSTASVIYDFAGSSGAVASNRAPIRSLEENCRVHLEFLEACDRAGHCPHIVFPSSWLVYDHDAGEQGRAIDERHPLGPRSIYGIHKLAIEQYLQLYARRGRVTYTICRISNPYGLDLATNPNYKILNAFVQKALANAPIVVFGDGRQLRDFLYITDLVDALEACGFREEARNEIFNIGSGERHRLLDAVQLIQDIAGGPAVMFQPWPDEYLATEPGDSREDVSKARLRLGVQANYTLRAGLAETITQYTQHRAARARAAGG